MKTSPNESIKNLWKATSDNKNIQYDVYTTTKEVLKSFNSQRENKLQNHLVVQGFFFSNVIKFSLKKLNSLWSKSQSNLPKNIYNFTIRYINNSLPTRRNLTKWGIISNSDCSFCLKPETLLHVVAGCQSYLPRFTWRHDSVLNFIAKMLQPVSNSNLFVDLPGYKALQLYLVTRSVQTFYCPSQVIIYIFSNSPLVMNLTSKQMLSGKEKDTKISLQNKRNVISLLNLLIYR